MRNYVLVATRDGRNLILDWCKTVFDLDTNAVKLESKGFKTKAWIVVQNNNRERLW